MIQSQRPTEIRAIRPLGKVRSVARVSIDLREPQCEPPLSKTSRFALDPTYATLVLTALLWSSNFVIGRAVRDDVSPATLNFLRWAIALLILLPVTMSDLRAHRVALARNWKLIALLGFTGIAAFQTLRYVALTKTTALNTSRCFRSRRSPSSHFHGWRSASA